MKLVAGVRVDQVLREEAGDRAFIGNLEVTEFFSDAKYLVLDLKKHGLDSFCDYSGDETSVIGIEIKTHNGDVIATVEPSEVQQAVDDARIKLAAIGVAEIEIICMDSFYYDVDFDSVY